MSVRRNPRLESVDDSMSTESDSEIEQTDIDLDATLTVSDNENVRIVAQEEGKEKD